MMHHYSKLYLLVLNYLMLHYLMLHQLMLYLMLDYLMLNYFKTVLFDVSHRTQRILYSSVSQNSLEAKINFELYLKHGLKKQICFYLGFRKKKQPVVFLKIFTLQTFNGKQSVSQKTPKARLLSSFPSQNTLTTFFRFISSGFFQLLKAA